MAALFLSLTLALVLPSSANTFARRLSAVLAEAPEWAQRLPGALGIEAQQVPRLLSMALASREAWARAEQDQATQPLAAALGTTFPDSLRDQFDPDPESVTLKDYPTSVSFKASIKKSGIPVELKLLKKKPTQPGEATQWLTKADEIGPYSGAIELVRDGCLNATEVYKNAKYDADGGKMLSQCLVDGISDAKLGEQPLFVAMEWSGDTLSRFRLDSENFKGEKARETMVTLARQMMMGLRCMSNKDAEVQWVHHNLNPESIQVLTDGPTPQVKFANFEAVLSSKDPEGLSGSNTWFRPPEFAGLTQNVGFKAPVHSFDASSAALTLIGLLSTDNVPQFYFEAILSSLLKNLQLYMPTRIARCIREKCGRRDEFQKFLESWERCVTKVEHLASFAGEIESKLLPLRQAVSDRDRKRELAFLVRCHGFDPASRLNDANAQMVETIIADWVDTAFDRVLLSMLHPDPETRLTPEQVLGSQWFKSLPPRVRPVRAHHCLEVSFAEQGVQEVMKLATTILASVAALLLTGVCAGCCCLCGTCCSIVGNAPSATWTGVVVTTCVMGGASASGIWLSGGALTFLKILALMLGVALVVTGCIMARTLPTKQQKLAWVVSLVAALLFCAGLFLGLRGNANPLLSVLGYVQRHSSEAAENLQVDVSVVEKSAQVLEQLVWFTFYPPILGTMIASFGLWRAYQRTQRERQASQVMAAPVEGMEMRSSYA